MKIPASDIIDMPLTLVKCRKPKLVLGRNFSKLLKNELSRRECERETLKTGCDSRLLGGDTTEVDLSFMLRYVNCAVC